MIKIRLVRLLSHAKKYIVYNVLWQWMALLLQIGVIFTVTGILSNLVSWGLAGGTDNFFENVLAALPGNVSAASSGFSQNAAGLPVRVGFLLAALIGRFFCDKMAAEASCRASVDVKRILRGKIYEKMLALGASYKEKIATSEVVQMSGEGVEQLEIYFGKYLPQLFYSLLAPVTLFLILCRVSLKASVILLICVPLIPLSIVAVQKIAGRLFRRYWGYYSNLGDVFLENLQGLTTLKIYQADAMKAEEMDEASDQFRKITMKVLTMQLNSTSVMDVVAYGGAAVGMAVSISEYFAGSITMMQALCITLLASEFFIPLRLLGSLFHIAMNGMAASDKIFAFLDMEEPADGTEEFPVAGRETAPTDRETAPTDQETAPDIMFQDVCFSYESDRPVLKDISVTISSGSLVSLVGVSGCGKSTIAGLLTGRNKGYAGDIFLENVPLSRIKESALLAHITMVSHNSYLFKGTVEENLRMAAPMASEQEMREALEKVNLWEFLETRGGLLASVAERGSNFSGGQCQRLALARAILHDTPIYIFDEATSNIDAESEEMIMGVIHALARTKTVLLISHRLSNVVRSDCICMMEAGQIVESGTHEELMRRQSAYYKLYTAQRELEQYGKGGEAYES